METFEFEDDFEFFFIVFIEKNCLIFQIKLNIEYLCQNANKACYNTIKRFSEQKTIVMLLSCTTKEVQESVKQPKPYIQANKCKKYFLKKELALSHFFFRKYF